MPALSDVLRPDHTGCGSGVTVQSGPNGETLLLCTGCDRPTTRGVGIA